MPWLYVGAWPNPAGSCRDIDGYIDAVAISDTNLAPNQFVLSYPGHTDVDEWTQY